MRFLVDAALAPAVAAALRAAGHDAVHVRDRGLQAASDRTVLELARAEQRVLLSADTDFAALLLAAEAAGPSVILFRRTLDRRPGRQVEILLANLEALAEPLHAGAIVIVEDTRIRIRLLPLADTDRTPPADEATT